MQIIFVYNVKILAINKINLYIDQIMNAKPTVYEVACRLAEFYEQPFGGKPKGRYRISPKNLRGLIKRRRITDEYVRLLAEEMFDLGYVFIDLESYYTVTSSRTLSNYRRVSDALVGTDREK